MVGEFSNKMSIADLLINIIIWLVQSIILPVLPTSLPFLPLTSFTEILNGIIGNLSYSFIGLEFLLPIDLIFMFVLVVLFAEMTLMIFKMGVFIINLVRGSGA